MKRKCLQLPLQISVKAKVSQEVITAVCSAD